MKNSQMAGSTLNGSGYEDILYQSRPVSKYHTPMPIEARAAQFAPFAALTGYEGAIRETTLQHQEDVAQEIEHVIVEEDIFREETLETEEFR